MDAAMVRIGIGQRARARREELHLEQADVARLADISPSYISRLESGQAGERVVDLMKVAKALGITVSSLIGEETEAYLAEVRRRLPNGTEMAVILERIALGLPDQQQTVQEFVTKQLAAIAEAWGAKTETLADR